MLSKSKCYSNLAKNNLELLFKQNCILFYHNFSQIFFLLYHKLYHKTQNKITIYIFEKYLFFFTSINYLKYIQQNKNKIIIPRAREINCLFFFFFKRKINLRLPSFEYNTKQEAKNHLVAQFPTSAVIREPTKSHQTA